MTEPASLLRLWRDHANCLRRYGAQAQARVLETAADELEAALEEQNDDLLTLNQAAALSGYSADHLGRLVRSGRLPNHGERHAPRIRKQDLPRKPSRSGEGAPSNAGGYNADRLFRDIINSKKKER